MHLKGYTNMYRKRDLFIFAAAAALSGSATCDEVGLGVSFFQDSGILFAPIAITPSFRVEPYLGFYKNSATSTQPYARSNSSYVFGTGAFATKRVAENIQLYGGSRVAYLRRKQTYSDFPQDTSIRTSGYLVAPTVGFEYFLQRNISIGAEAGVSYTRTSGHDSYPANEADTKESTTSTTTAMTIRYYWN